MKEGELTMKKKTFTGWIGKDDKLCDVVFWIGSDEAETLVCQCLYKNKGKRDSWVEESWPPIKVKITIEITE